MPARRPLSRERLELYSKAHEDPHTNRARLQLLSEAFPVGLKVKTQYGQVVTVVAGDKPKNSIGGNTRPSERIGSAYRGENVSRDTNWIATETAEGFRNGLAADSLIVVEEPLPVIPPSLKTGDRAVLLKAEGYSTIKPGDTVEIIRESKLRPGSFEVERVSRRYETGYRLRLTLSGSALQKVEDEVVEAVVTSTFQVYSEAQIEQIKDEAFAAGKRQGLRQGRREGIRDARAALDRVI
jgi:hypothetical protein